MAGRRPNHRSRYGYTILELLIVVFMVGVLAAIAIPVFQRYQLRSKSAEAKTNLGAIRVLENSHYSENDAFVAVAPEPAVIPGPTPSDFDASGGFAPLGFRPEGRVYFSYGVAVSGDGVGFTADAGGDLDGDGFVQFWGYTTPDSAGAFSAGPVGCDVAGLSSAQVGPCDPSHGRSVF